MKHILGIQNGRRQLGAAPLWFFKGAGLDSPPTKLNPTSQSRHQHVPCRLRCLNTALTIDPNRPNAPQPQTNRFGFLLPFRPSTVDCQPLRLYFFTSFHHLADSYACPSHHNASLRSSSECISNECHRCALIFVPVPSRKSRAARSVCASDIAFILKRIAFADPIARVTGSAANTAWLR